MTRVGALPDRALARRQRGQHQRPVGVVLGRRDRDLALERAAGLGYQKTQPRPGYRAFGARDSPDRSRCNEARITTRAAVAAGVRFDRYGARALIARPGRIRTERAHTQPAPRTALLRGSMS